MPYYYYEEIKTPLKLLGIRIMKDDKGKIWIKFKGKPRRMLRKTRKKSKSRYRVDRKEQMRDW